MAAERLFSSPTFRFSIRQLLLGTALVAVACVALRSASSVWVTALLGLVLLVLTAAVPLAIFRQGGDRAWWFGFALFGWLYMLLLAYSWGLDPNTSQTNPLRPYSLATAQISSSGYTRIYADGSANPVRYYVPATTGPMPPAYPVTTYTTVVQANGAILPPPVYQAPAMPAGFTYYLGTNVAPPTFSGPSHDDFINVAHAFWAMVIAVCGGWFTCWVYKTRSPPSPSLVLPPDPKVV